MNRDDYEDFSITNMTCLVIICRGTSFKMCTVHQRATTLLGPVKYLSVATCVVQVKP